MNDTRVSPRDLRRQAPRKVEERMLDIWGMIDGNSGVIHSKMILTDRSVSWTILKYFLTENATVYYLMRMRVKVLLCIFVVFCHLYRGRDRPIKKMFVRLTIVAFSGLTFTSAAPIWEIAALPRPKKWESWSETANFWVKMPERFSTPTGPSTAWNPCQTGWSFEDCLLFGRFKRLIFLWYSIGHC